MESGGNRRREKESTSPKVRPQQYRQITKEERLMCQCRLSVPSGRSGQGLCHGPCTTYESFLSDLITEGFSP